MHHAVGPQGAQHVQQVVVVLADRQAVRADAAAGDLRPGGEPGVEVLDRGERARAQLLVDAPAGQVIDDLDIMAARGQVQGRGPSAESVAAEDENRTCLTLFALRWLYDS